MLHAVPEPLIISAPRNSASRFAVVIDVDLVAVIGERARHGAVLRDEVEHLRVVEVDAARVQHVKASGSRRSRPSRSSPPASRRRGTARRPATGRS